MNGLHRGGRKLALLCILAVACSSPDHLADGDRFFRQQQFPAAIASYERVLESEPGHPHALRQLGMAYGRVGRPNDAYPQLERALELRPTDTEVGVFLGRLYLEEERLVDAERVARLLTGSAPADADAYVLLGAVHMEAGRFGDARVAFQRVVALVPDHGRGPHLVGMALRAEGRAEEARASFERALELTPGYYEPLVQLVDMSRAENRLVDGINRVRRQIGVASSAALFTLAGVLHVEQGEAALAESAFVTATQVDPRFAEAHVRLSALYLMEEQYAMALAAASDAVRAEPGNPAGMLHLGYTYQQLGELSKAQQAYQEVLQLDPASSVALNNLAWVLAESEGDLELAQQLAEQAQAVDPNNPNIIDTLGWIHFKAGRHDEAVRLLSESAAQRPNDAGRQYRLGMAYVRAGDVAEGRRALTRAAGATAATPERDAARAALTSLR
jgi:Flp pilus assembly protein TadD